MKIEKGTTVRGSFQVEGDLVIEGSLEGKVVVSGRLVVEHEGSIAGEVRCSGGTLRGRMSGALHSDEPIEVDHEARISGRLVAPALDFGAEPEPRPDRTMPPRPSQEHRQPQASYPQELAQAQDRRSGAPRRPPTVTGDRGQVLVQPTAVLRNDR